jgi:hypothetical protein
MLIALGFQPVKAAAVSLVANTAPVAFGAIAVPITTLAPLANLPKDDLGAMVGRQTPFLALIVPLILIGMVDGRRGIRAAWPAAAAGGVAFAIGQFACSNYLSVELTDIVASLLSAAAIVALLQVWRPGEVLAAPAGPRPAMAGGETEVDQRRFTKEAERRAGATPDGRVKRDSAGEMLVAFSPYLIIIGVFALAQIHWLPFFDWLDARTKPFSWPELHILNAKGIEPTAVTFKFNWANAAGTLLLLSGLLTMLSLRIRPARGAARVRRYPQPAQVRDPHGRHRAGAGLRHEPLGPDDHDRQLAGRRRQRLRLPVAGPGLARGRCHGLGHIVQRALRRAAGLGRPEGRPLAHADGRGELERRGAGQDDLAPEPRHWCRGGGDGWPGRRPVP